VDSIEANKGPTNVKDVQLNVISKSTTASEVKLSLLPEVIREEQLKDKDIAPVIQYLKEGRKPTWQEVKLHSTETQHYIAQFESLRMINGIAYREFQLSDGTILYTQLLVPHNLRMTVLEEIHGSPFSGHFAVQKTVRRLQTIAYWQGYFKDCEIVVRKCFDM
jgi:hypothetical protein